jgi:hypothetical protein
MKYLIASLILIGFLMVGRVIAEPTPDNNLDRIPVTGCPYGDSILLEYCDKFAPAPQPADLPDESVEVYYGK